MTARTRYVDASIPAVWEDKSLLDHMPNGRAGVYLFDGDKSTSEAAYAGLAGVVPFLAPEALIFVDDANEITIRLAVHQFVTTYPKNVFTILDVPTPGNCWPMFWNGIMALAWRR